MSPAQDITDWPVMASCCSTCPFKLDEHGRQRDPLLAAMVTERCLSGASQICHHPRISGQEENHLCRGARNIMQELMFELGVIEAPTDAAWTKAWDDMKGDDNATVSGR